MINITIPIRTVSEANLGGEHWTKKSKRHKAQRAAVTLMLRPLILAKSDSILPCKITMTRIAPRSLDFDNLATSFKYILDSVCELLVPGLAKGRADGDKRISVEYKQEKGLPKTYAVRIEIQAV